MTNVLRPMTVGELLDRTFFLYRGHFGLFVGIAALPNLITLTFQLARVVVFSSDSGVLLAFLWILATVLVYLVSLALSQGATVVAVSQIQLGRDTSISGAFSAIRSRIGAISLIILGIGLRLAVAFLFLIIPGIWYSVVWALAIPVAVLEETNLSDSLARSAALTAGHRGRVFLIYFLILTLIYVVSLLVQVPVMVAVALRSGGISAGELSVPAQIVIGISSFVTQSLLSPIMTIALSLLYYDERVRKEAFDLEHMMQQLDRATPRPAPAA